MRKIVIILATALLLAGCGIQKRSMEPYSIVAGGYCLEVIEYYPAEDITVLYDRETGVMYMKYYPGGLVVMRNADGTPKIHQKSR